MSNIAQISRDPFARETTMRQKKPNYKKVCDNCDGTDGHGNVYWFYVEPDSINFVPTDNGKRFCCVNCFRNFYYH